MASKDKTIWTASGENMITSDIATKMEAMPPAAKYMIELLISQDLADRERRTVVTIAGALIKKCVMLLISGIDASVISDALHKTASKAVGILTELTDPAFLMLNGAGAPVIELSRQLNAWAKVLHGMESNCVKSFAEALEAIPYTLPENAELESIDIVTELRKKLAQEPLLVSVSGIPLAIEVVTKVLKKLEARNSSWYGSQP